MRAYTYNATPSRYAANGYGQESHSQTPANRYAMNGGHGYAHESSSREDASASLRSGMAGSAGVRDAREHGRGVHADYDAGHRHAARHDMVS